MLLKMINGGIVNITEDKDYYPGCETCDYGSSYFNEFKIELTTINIKIKASQMYEYPLSDGHMMKIILPNVEAIQKMTEKEFSVWLKNELKQIDDVDKLEYTVS